MKVDVVVVGAGASGLMCAMKAGGRGRSVLVLDHAPKIGSKVLISGGGSCNFSNVIVSREHYISHNPHFVTSAVSRFTPGDFISLLDRHGIRWHERELGRLFCDGSAHEVVEMLRSECEQAGVRFLLGCDIFSIARESRFRVETSRGVFGCESLVVAAGGLSMPRLGASNLGGRIAKQFGMRVTPLRPALTPLRFGRDDSALFGALSGISMDVSVSYKAAVFRDSLLFTHRGLSGPAALQISSYWDDGGPIVIDLLPGLDLGGVFTENRGGKMLLTTLLERRLPGRFVKAWSRLRGWTPRPLKQYEVRELDEVAGELHAWRVQPVGVEGFNKAEVTLGGVDTAQLSSKTMESTTTPGLYFIGEVVDATGQLGGYNLHWAWASGHAAGMHV